VVHGDDVIGPVHAVVFSFCVLFLFAQMRQTVPFFSTMARCSSRSLRARSKSLRPMAESCPSSSLSSQPRSFIFCRDVVTRDLVAAGVIIEAAARLDVLGQDVEGAQEALGGPAALVAARLAAGFGRGLGVIGEARNERCSEAGRRLDRNLLEREVPFEVGGGVVLVALSTVSVAVRASVLPSAFSRVENDPHKCVWPRARLVSLQLVWVICSCVAAVSFDRSGGREPAARVALRPIAILTVAVEWDR
jgi:hypothetical protein